MPEAPPAASAETAAHDVCERDDQQRQSGARDDQTGNQGPGIGTGQELMGPNALRYIERVLAIVRAGRVPDRLAVLASSC
jgi:hypothetical protein